MVLRSIAVAGQIAAVAATVALGIVLPLWPVIAVIALLVAFNAAVWMRLRRARPATHAEIAANLLLDLAAFTLLLYFSGGAENPFVLIFVLHVVLTALLLPPPLAALGVVLVIAGYSWVDRAHLPLRLANGDPPPAALVRFGYWLAFALTSAVVAWFVIRIARELRRHDRLLREAAQRAFNDETIARLGALAAGAAHELATPLTTMAMTADAMRTDASAESIRRGIGVIGTEVEACRRTISNLLAAAGHARAEGGGAERMTAFLERVANRFRAMRPDVALTLRADGDRAAPTIFADQSIEQAILVLLNNAADVSPRDVELTGRWEGTTLAVRVDDRGKGVDASHRDKLGRVFFTTKAPGQGTGLGLVLASNAINGVGGELRWRPRAGGGTRAEMVLPLAALELPERS